jgi:hypothetical protein
VSALFSTASQPPKTPVRGSVDADGSDADLTAAGSYLCVKKTTFECGKKSDLIS